jgi:hypothetical protein
MKNVLENAGWLFVFTLTIGTVVGTGVILGFLLARAMQL